MKSIEKVEVGDQVWAFDVKSGEWQLKRVFATHSHVHEGSIVKVTVGDDVIESTDLHPYFVISGEDLESRTAAELPEAEQGMTARGRWVSACDLRVGDVLQARGKTVVVDAVESYEAAVEVFNFGVEGLRSYAVGKAGVLVHNSSAEGSTAISRTGAVNRADDGAVAALKVSRKGKNAPTADPEDIRQIGILGELDIQRRIERNPSVTLVASQIEVVTPHGSRFIDHLIRDKKGRLLAIEVKANSAERSTIQIIKDNDIASGKGVFAGVVAENAGLLGQKARFNTIVANPRF